MAGFQKGIRFRVFYSEYTLEDFEVKYLNLRVYALHSQMVVILSTSSVFNSSKYYRIIG